MVTVTPHLRNPVGVLLLTDSNERGIFKSILEAETAIPVRRTAIFNAPKDGGDVLVKVCEGARHIKVTKPEPKTQANGTEKEADDDDDEEEEEEEEEKREKVHKVGTVLAEAAIKGVKKGGKIEVTLNVSVDQVVQVTAREVGAKGGVRGSLEKSKVAENGTA